RDYVTGEIELAIELERSRVDRQCAGGRAGLRGLVDDSWLRAELDQPQREHQTRGPSADDQHVRAGHIFLHLTLFAEDRNMGGQKPVVLSPSTKIPASPPKSDTCALMCSTPFFQFAFASGSTARDAGTSKLSVISSST